MRTLALTSCYHAPLCGRCNSRLRHFCNRLNCYECGNLESKIIYTWKASLQYEDFDLKNFNSSVGETLLGTALMCREFVKFTNDKNNEEKLILNIGSDLSVIAPDNRIYGTDINGNKIYKPIEYSVTKHGIIGLTKYLAVYLAEKNYRVNSLSPTGVFNNQDKEFVKKFSKTVPLGRMIEPEELISHVTYLTSSDSRFLTGQNILVDGGRSIW